MDFRIKIRKSELVWTVLSRMQMSLYRFEEPLCGIRMSDFALVAEPFPFVYINASKSRMFVIQNML